MEKRGGWTRTRPIRVAALCTVLAACGSGQRGATGPSLSSHSPITREEIGDRGALDLYSVVQQLRPNWLQSRGQVTPVGGARTVRVVIDGRLQPGAVEVLRSLRGTEVHELSYMSGQDAQTRFGMDTEAGVIIVTTERGVGGTPDA